jgi:mono/diheme cytochrome c family protein
MRLQPSALAALVLFSLGACARNSESAATRVADADAGRALFVSKGCVMCHAVNGVGGKAAPALDAPNAPGGGDVAAFAAAMWRGAGAMVELQNLELGYVIDLDADELTHLAAFVGDLAAQKKLAATDVPETLRDSILDERFWETEDWDEFLRRGQEGYGEPPAEETPPTP